MPVERRFKNDWNIHYIGRLAGNRARNILQVQTKRSKALWWRAFFFADSGDSMHVHKCQHEFIKKDSIVSKSHAHYFFLNQTIASNQKQIRFRFVSFRFAAVDIFFQSFHKISYAIKIHATIGAHHTEQ